MNIAYATDLDYQYVRDRDHHVLENLLVTKIKANEIYILKTASGDNIGWMRYGYFWDNTPFLNMLWIDEPYRRRGLGQEAVSFWEHDMRQKGFDLVMTSTLANETAQLFYRKLGYKDAGCLLLDSEPLEIVFTKPLV